MVHSLAPTVPAPTGNVGAITAISDDDLTHKMMGDMMLNTAGVEAVVAWHGSDYSDWKSVDSGSGFRVT